MLLTIDIGNTNIVFGLFSESNLDFKNSPKNPSKLSGNSILADQVLAKFRIETRNSRSAEEYFIFLNSLLQTTEHKISKISSVIISSVVPACEFEIERFCKKFLKISPYFIDHKIADEFGLKIKLERPSEIGADRLVNSIAALGFRKYPIIIIDFGTATTFDVINSKKEYIGGIIAAGITLSINALQKAASKLPKINIAKPNKVIGNNTIDAMQSGVYFGYLGMIEGCIEKISKELKENGEKNKPLVIATGGLAGYFKDSKLIDKIEEDLTLKGLKEINKIVTNKLSLKNRK